ncbi:MAG TPA: chemotaxis protein CheW [Pseudomonadales bacterium]|nr:chemotaxis protein CheW [Pseudomonadales bacterium]
MPDSSEINIIDSSSHTLHKNRFDWQELRRRVASIAQHSQAEISVANVEQLLEERAERFSRSGNVEHTDNTEVIVFVQGDTRYAIPLHMLTEIRPITRITVLPKVAENIMGVINVRGRIVAVYNLTTHTHEYGKDITGSALIGHEKADSVAIHADNVIGAEKISADAIKPAPISIADKDYITGIGADGLIFLDLDKFVHYQHRTQA